jgi:hypothetical protein
MDDDERCCCREWLMDDDVGVGEWCMLMMNEARMNQVSFIHYNYH